MASNDPYFLEWTCAFAGKMALSWKRAWHDVGTKEEAEAQAAKNCNVVAIPLQLYEHIKAMEHRVVLAEGKLVELGIRMDYKDGKATFVDLKGTTKS